MSDRKKVTVAMLIATFLSAIEVTVVSTAIPRIASDLGGIQYISWVFAAYLLASTVTIPIFGKLADLFGRKRVFMFGGIVFLICSMLSGTAGSMTWLIWFRAVQGVGAGALNPTTFTIIGDLYPYEQRAKVQGLFSSVWGLAGLVGPLIGGFLVDYVSWRWIFYINLPFGLLAMLMVMLFLKEEGEIKEKPEVDYLGALTFFIAVTSLLFVLSVGGTEVSWTTPYLQGLAAAGGIGFILFFWIETKAREPMLPLRLFQIPSILVANVISFLASSILIALNVYTPLWVQGVIGYGAAGSGMVLLPMSLAWMSGAFVGGRLMLKTGPRLTAFFGMLFILAGCLALGNIDIHTPGWILPVVMLANGFGFGFVMTVCTVIVQSSVKWNLRATATASNTFLRSLGQTVGVTVFGALFNLSLQNNAWNQKMQIPVSEINRLLDAHGLSAVPKGLLSGLRETLALGMHHIFLILIGIAVVNLGLTLALPAGKPDVQARTVSDRA